MSEKSTFPTKTDRVTILTYGGKDQSVWSDWSRSYVNVDTVQHWQLEFDGQFIADTSAPHHLRKWEELAALANGTYRSFVLDRDFSTCPLCTGYKNHLILQMEQAQGACLACKPLENHVV